MWRKYIYVKLVEMKEANFWRGDEAKFLVCMIIRMCAVDSELDCNQLMAEVDLDFFLS
jgi:hypothetical protein